MTLLEAFKKSIRLINALKLGDCWCEKAIDNPMFKDHTSTCKEIRQFISELEDGTTKL